MPLFINAKVNFWIVRVVKDYSTEQSSCFITVKSYLISGLWIKFLWHRISVICQSNSQNFKITEKQECNLVSGPEKNKQCVISCWLLGIDRTGKALFTRNLFFSCCEICSSAAVTKNKTPQPIRKYTCCDIDAKSSFKWPNMLQIYREMKCNTTLLWWFVVLIEKTVSVLWCHCLH